MFGCTFASPTSSAFLYALFVLPSVFSLSAYRRVLSVWSADEEPGFMQAIITIFALLPKKESRRTIDSLDALKGTWPLL